MAIGKVVLVGAGPGDPKLITVRGLEAIQKADVIVYDRLASPQLLDYAGESAELIYCGKKSNNHTLTQEEINLIIVRRAREGKRVVRLKGGDPFVFGRGGEEAEDCVKFGIPFDIIPGVTSGIAAPAFAGIPVTHRDYNSSFAIVTGHKSSANEKKEINWSGLAQAVDTIIFYMGVSNLPDIAQNLIQGGKSPHTPVALVRWGTCSEQSTLTGTLENIADRAREASFKSPAIIIVGEVVKLREKLNWYEKKPLFGKKIAAVRAGLPQEEVLLSQLDDLAAHITEISAAVPGSVGRLFEDAAAGVVHMVAFTSPESVRDLFGTEADKDTAAVFSGIEFLCADLSTALSLKEAGLNPDYVMNNGSVEKYRSRLSIIA